MESTRQSLPSFPLIKRLHSSFCRSEAAPNLPPCSLTSWKCSAISAIRTRSSSARCCCCCCSPPAVRDPVCWPPRLLPRALRPVRRLPVLPTGTTMLHLPRRRPRLIQHSSEGGMLEATVSARGASMWWTLPSSEARGRALSSNGRMFSWSKAPLASSGACEERGASVAGTKSTLNLHLSP